MDRETFCKKIIEKIEKLEKISKNDMECSSKYGRGLKAFYFNFLLILSNTVSSKTLSL